MENRGQGSLTALLAVLTALLTFGVTGQQLQAVEPTDSDWHLTTSGGIWGMSMNGTTGLRNFETDVDADFSDLFDKTNFSFNPGAELSKDNWIFSFNGSIAKLSDDVSIGANGRGFDVDMFMGVFDLDVGYTLVRTKFGDMPFTLTPVVGGQITYMSLEIDPNFSGSEKRDKTWFDPYVGARAKLGLTEKVDLRAEGTIGGFGVASDLTWSAGAYVDWYVWKRWTLNVGYRAVSWDYDQDNFKWDMTFHGPWIGLTTSWF